MEETKDAKDAAEKEALFEHMVYTCADSVSEKKQKKWVLKNFHKRL